MIKCPECGSEDNYVDDGPYLDGPDDDRMYLTRVCDDCGCEWREEYAIERYDDEVTVQGDKYKEDCE